MSPPAHPVLAAAGRQMGARIVRTAERIRADRLDYVTFMLVRQGTVSGVAEGPMAWGAGEAGAIPVACPGGGAAGVKPADNDP